jgi:hypothetical protein
MWLISLLGEEQLAFHEDFCFIEGFDSFESVFVDKIFKPSCREVTSTVGVRNISSNNYSRLLTVYAV